MAGILSQAVNSSSQLYGAYTEESSTKAYSNYRRYGENTEALGYQIMEYEAVIYPAKLAIDI